MQNEKLPATLVRLNICRVLQPVWHGWRVLLLCLGHHLLIPCQRQIHSWAEVYLWSCAG